MRTTRTLEPPTGNRPPERRRQRQRTAIQAQRLCRRSPANPAAKPAPTPAPQTRTDRKPVAGRHIEDTIERMVQLKREGVGFALDDFGTGYSSLATPNARRWTRSRSTGASCATYRATPTTRAIVRTILALGAKPGPRRGGRRWRRRGSWVLRAAWLRATPGYLFGRPGPIEVVESQMRTSL